MDILLALSPIILALVLMTAFNVAPQKSLPLAWLLAVLLGMVHWHMDWLQVLSASLSGTGKSIDIILIIFGAVYLLNILTQTHVIQSINHSLAGVSADKRVQCIIIAWLFGGFIEGAAGFGAAPALAAPLLLGLGFPAIPAATAALICNSMPVPFGAVGTPVLTTFRTLEGNLATAQLEPAAFAADLLRDLTTIFGVVGILLPLFAVAMVILLSHTPNKWKSIIEIVPFCLFSGLSYVIPWKLCAVFLGPELPSMLGALIALLIVIPAAKAGFLIPKHQWDFGIPVAAADTPQTGAVQPLSLWKSYLPYGTVALLLVITRLPMLPIKDFLTQHLVTRCEALLGVAHSSFALAWLNNPGLLPFVVVGAVSGLALGLNYREVGQLAQKSFKQILPSAIAIASSVAIVQIMIISSQNAQHVPGMLTVISQATAKLGNGFFISAPFWGILGAFFAGSCTVSNILFVSIQFDTAQLLELSPALVCALQNVGGGIGSMIRLSGVVATCATVNAAGKEGKIILSNSMVAFISAVVALIVAALL